MLITIILIRLVARFLVQVSKVTPCRTFYRSRYIEGYDFRSFTQMVINLDTTWATALDQKKEGKKIVFVTETPKLITD